VNVRKVLEKPEVSDYRQVTPELQPPQTSLTFTPQDRYEFDEIKRIAQSKSTREVRSQIETLSHAYYAKHSARRILANELKESRKRTRDDEEEITNKRLQKQDEKRSWGLKELCKGRGYTDDEIDTFTSALPRRESIYPPPQEE